MVKQNLGYQHNLHPDPRYY